MITHHNGGCASIVTLFHDNSAMNELMFGLDER